MPWFFLRKEYNHSMSQDLDLSRLFFVLFFVLPGVQQMHMRTLFFYFVPISLSENFAFNRSD